MSPAYVVEVKEGVVEASQQGVEWWTMFTTRFLGTGRIVYTTQPSVSGGIAEVACDTRYDTDELAVFMVEHCGLPKTAVRVKEAAKVPAS
jgi:hypothetical protein